MPRRLTTVRNAVVSDAARAIAASLASGKSVGVFLGNLATAPSGCLRCTRLRRRWQP